MKLDITGRHLTVSDGMRTHTEERLEKVGKMFADEPETHVVLFVEKHRHVAEIQVKSRDGVFSAQESTSDLYISINEAIEKIEKQVRKFRDKRSDKRRRTGTTAAEAVEVITSDVPPREDEVQSSPKGAGEEGGPRILPSKQFRMKPLSPEDAVMELESNGQDVLVYRDSATDRLNVLHRLSDGNFGLVDPEF
jgi:putative sigma-54 modulation protein